MYQEWKELVSKSKKGDMEAKEEILNRLIPLIISSIKNYYNRRELYEELIQDGNLCILEAIESFEEDKNTYFLGYVKVQLKYMYLNKNREKQLLSLNTKIGEEKVDEILDTLISNDLEPLEEILDREIKRLVNENLKYLTRRQRDITVLFYVNNLSISEIAGYLGISYRTVVNTKTRAIEILKSKLDEKN